MLDRKLEYLNSAADSRRAASRAAAASAAATRPSSPPDARRAVAAFAAGRFLACGGIASPVTGALASSPGKTSAGQNRPGAKVAAGVARTDR